MLSGLRGEKKGLKPFLFLMPSSLASPGSGTFRKQLPADWDVDGVGDSLVNESRDRDSRANLLFFKGVTKSEK